MTRSKRVTRVVGVVGALVLSACGVGEADQQVAGSAEYLQQGVRCPAGTKLIMGTAGNDVLTGTHKADCIMGLGGDDRIEGGHGNDTLIGGPGNDDLMGNAGDDTLFGEDGDDALVGGHGDDEMFGGGGNDVIESGSGDDVAEGGLCHDRILGEHGSDALWGNAGADRIDDGSGHGHVNGGEGPDACDGRNCEIELCDGRGCKRRLWWWGGWGRNHGNGHGSWWSGGGHGGFDEDECSECADDTDCNPGERCVVATGVCVSPTAVPFSDVVCDGLDEDCDGASDEDFMGGATSCGVGACAATGVMACTAGAIVDSCMPGMPAASDASCDGVDDDCNGASDEDFAGGGSTTCGVGACAATGVLSCVGGMVTDSCMPGMPIADDSCNGVDDDCDGMMDEGYVPVATTCGVGLCEGQGATTCVDGVVVVDDCQPVVAEDDGNPCTLDICDPMLGILHPAAPVGSSCSDGDACNGEEVCGAGQTPFVSIEPRSTFLRTSSNDPSVVSVAHSLASLGLAPGQVVTFRVVGAMANSPSDQGSSAALGVFSASSTVLAATNVVARVPDAVQSDAPRVLTPTLSGNLPTDIPQDFAFDLVGVTLTIPAGATHFIAGVPGKLASDNSNLPGVPFGFVVDTTHACVPGLPLPVCN